MVISPHRLDCSRSPYILLLVLVPFFGYTVYINCSLIQLVLDYCLCIVHIFSGSSNNVNFFIPYSSDTMLPSWVLFIHFLL